MSRLHVAYIHHMTTVQRAPGKAIEQARLIDTDVGHTLAKKMALFFKVFMNYPSLGTEAGPAKSCKHCLQNDHEMSGQQDSVVLAKKPEWPA